MTATKLISRFLQPYTEVELPSAFFTFLEEQERLGHVIRRAKTFEPLRDYLMTLGVSPSTIKDLLDRDSRLVFRTSFPQLLEYSTAEIDAFFARRFDSIFALQETVLDSETLTGFNRHGREHLRTVTRRLLTLLRASELTPEEFTRVEKEAVIAGYLHDIGNLLSRKEHGTYGLYLLTQLFQDVDRDEATLASFMRILEAVLFHEVDFGSRLSSLSILSPITHSLIIADKTDVSFRRVSNKSNQSEAIQDAHMLVNLLAADSRIRYRNNSFQWEIHFSPTMRNGDSSRFSALLKREERVWVPDEWQKLYRRENIEYVFIFNATFLRLYMTRFAFAVRAVFALNPCITSFQLTIQDDERGVSLSRRFARSDYEAKLSMISHNLFKNYEDAAGAVNVPQE